jgi:hypothetical protein
MTPSTQIQKAIRLMLVTVLVFPSADPLASTLNERYLEFTAKQRTLVPLGLKTKELSENISASYRKFKQGLQFDDGLTRFSDIDLLLLFRAADEASFYTSLPEHASDMEALAGVLQERRAVTSSHLTKTYFALIAAREFDRARQWRISNGLIINASDYEIDSTPPLNDQPGELRLGTKEVEYFPFKFPKGGFVLVIAHPQCHFSNYLLQHIYGDNVLLDKTRGKLKWMSPQQREENSAIFRDWNASYKEARITQAYLASQWTSVDFWETPTLYFYYDGVLKKKIVGWPKSGRRKELDSALLEIKLFEHTSE